MLAASLSARTAIQEPPCRARRFGSTPDEGASTVGLNLAAALAETGRSDYLTSRRICGRALEDLSRDWRICYRWESAREASIGPAPGMNQDL